MKKRHALENRIFSSSKDPDLDPDTALDRGAMLKCLNLALGFYNASGVIIIVTLTAIFIELFDPDTLNATAVGF